MRSRKVVEEDDNLVVCLPMLEVEKEKRNKKESLTQDNVKKPKKAGILCNTDREIFHSFTKKMWIGNLGSLSNIPTMTQAFMMSLT